MPDCPSEDLASALVEAVRSSWGLGLYWALRMNDDSHF